MARACVKVFIDDKIVRTFGDNKSSITYQVAKMKEATFEELKEMYPSLKEGSSFRYSIIRVKRKNKVYRFCELQDDLSEQEFEKIIPNEDVLQSLLYNLKYLDTKLNIEILFNKSGEIDCNKQYDLIDLLTGYVRKDVVKKFGKEQILKKILEQYDKILSRC